LVTIYRKSEGRTAAKAYSKDPVNGSAKEQVRDSTASLNFGALVDINAVPSFIGKIMLASTTTRQPLEQA
jgi:hypothetical protein